MMRGVSDAPFDLDRLLSLSEPPGSHALTLAVGPWRIALEGLDAGIAAALDTRWGGHALRDPDASPTLTVRLVIDPGPPFLVASPGETYRTEGGTERGSAWVRSYRFAAAEEEGALWRAAIVRDGGEPEPRLLDNLARHLVARCVLESGGLAFHGAGVAEEGKGYLFLGPSRAGKSTAARLTGAESLGDDFAVAWPSGSGWFTCAVPFDNAERMPPIRRLAPVPLARILKLEKAEEDAVVPIEGAARAAAALVSCAAFPWAMGELGGRIAENAASAPAPAILRFRPTPSFWSLVVTPRR